MINNEINVIEICRLSDGIDMLRYLSYNEKNVIKYAVCLTDLDKGLNMLFVYVL